jgi:hypothetical protein
VFPWDRFRGTSPACRHSAPPQPPPLTLSHMESHTSITAQVQSGLECGLGADNWTSWQVGSSLPLVFHSMDSFSASVVALTHTRDRTKTNLCQEPHTHAHVLGV